MKLYETITAENWCQGSYWQDSRGLPTSSRQFARACVSGHSLAKWDGDDAHTLRMAHLADAIRVLFPDRDSHHVLFNDHPDTTLDDVIRVCKLADV